MSQEAFRRGVGMKEQLRGEQRVRRPQPAKEGSLHSSGSFPVGFKPVFVISSENRVSP